MKKSKTLKNQQGWLLNMASQNQTVANWTKLSSSLAAFMFVWSIFRQWSVIKKCIPYEIRRFIARYSIRVFEMLSPYIQLTIDEYVEDNLYSGNTIYRCVRAYLDEHGCKTPKKFRLHSPRKGERIFRMSNGEEVTDRYKSITVWWVLIVTNSDTTRNRACYKLVFHRKHKEFVRGEYLDHVIQIGTSIIDKRKVKIKKLWLNKCTNLRGEATLSSWTSVQFDHPATFDNLAMNPVKKKKIVDDLLKFTRNKDFYARVGKAWKRGYLLYGPPGTGKSTMIAAMANLLGYDVYDLELTGVKSNEQLRRLLINTAKRSIIAIEDIDCSLDLSRKRETKPAKNDRDRDNDETSQSVTLSGLLNFIDGIWSSSEGERIIVFTTNSLSKLDPALIRTGRMDKHIEMSYCCFEGFKVLAKNYLLLDTHPKFDVIKGLLETTKMTPADVGENLMPKVSDEEEEDEAEACLDDLIYALKKAHKKEQAAIAKQLENKKKKETKEAKLEEETAASKLEEVKQESSQADETE